MKIAQLIMAGGIAAASVVGFGGMANAAPACTQGTLSVVIDDSGVQHEACVASAVEFQSATSDMATLLLPAQSAPGPSTAELPATGLGVGGLLIAALLVIGGSVASLVSRRKV